MTFQMPLPMFMLTLMSMVCKLLMAKSARQARSIVDPTGNAAAENASGGKTQWASRLRDLGGANKGSQTNKLLKYT